ncbi:hypothetical protein pdam_00014880, partial [Pocillopora damicornis]
YRTWNITGIHFAEKVVVIHRVFRLSHDEVTCDAKPNNSAEPAKEFKATAVLPYVKGLSEQLRRCLRQQGFIDRDPYYYTRKVKEAIHIRLHPNNIADSGIEILEAWKPTIKKKYNNRRAVRQRTAEGANH